MEILLKIFESEENLKCYEFFFEIFEILKCFEIFEILEFLKIFKILKCFENFEILNFKILFYFYFRILKFNKIFEY